MLSLSSRLLLSKNTEEIEKKLEKIFDDTKFAEEYSQNRFLWN